MEGILGIIIYDLIPFIFSGLSGSFNTVLIDHFRRNKLQDESNSKFIFETLLGLYLHTINENIHTYIVHNLGTLEDCAPIFIAVLGGFLQQVFGPKKILIASGFSGFVSWLIVFMQPCSIYCLLLSRFIAGLSNGLLTGNVYMADTAPSKYISSFKSIEVSYVKF